VYPDPLGALDVDLGDVTRIHGALGRDAQAD
jgi:hypothetical protein